MSVEPTAVLPSGTQTRPGADPWGHAWAMMAAARLRGATSSDVISFTATCPACETDCTWEEERIETRLHARVLCLCDVPACGPTASPHPTAG